jgi:hypothetical protein
MTKKLTQEYQLPPPLQGFSPKEIFLLTGIPLYLLQGFKEGEFKPNYIHREKLSDISRPLYKWNEFERTAFIQRKKYREVRSFISWAEKDELLNQPQKYAERLDKLVDKYWDRIVIAVTEKFA